jgi:hypothetical protein
VRIAVTMLGAVVCAGLTLEAFADEPRRTLDMSRAFDAGPLAAPTNDIQITSTPADPPPLVERGQWVFDLRWDRGDVWLLGVTRRDLPSPQATPRVMGRFALELFEGPALIERVRFDFPLLGVVEPDGGMSLTSKLKTRIGVVFPATRKGTRLELWDRASGRRWALPWPVEADGGK